MSSRTHYETLGVSSTASQSEIKGKYRSLVLKHHPDVSEAPDAEQTFLKLKVAFEVLSDEGSRMLYDEELRVRHAPLFRGDPWPTGKYAKQQQYRGNGGFGATPHDPNGARKHNIPEWERMHYGIGDPPPHSSKYWPTGEREEHLSDHQLYFKHRAERMAKGGRYPWQTSSTSKKFSTWSRWHALVRQIV